MCLAIPGRVVELLPERENLALVEVSGVRRKIDVGLLDDDPAKAGDWVLIHVGFAMSKIGEKDAADQMRVLAMLGEDEAAMREIEGYGLGGADLQVGVPFGPGPPGPAGAGVDAGRRTGVLPHEE
jgi:hydrogenase expression/formation protein HypC